MTGIPSITSPGPQKPCDPDDDPDPQSPAPAGPVAALESAPAAPLPAGTHEPEPQRVAVATDAAPEPATVAAAPRGHGIHEPPRASPSGQAVVDWVDADRPAARSVAPVAAMTLLPARQASLFPEEELRRTGGAPRAAVFRVQCLGPFQVRVGDASIEHWPLEKARELLALLVAHGGTSVAREVVAEALWPGYDWDASLKHTLANIATTLRSTLRTAADDGELQPLIAVRQRLQLPGALFAADIDAFEAALRRAATLPELEALEEYERALGLYAGDYLEGELFNWLDPYRLEYRRRFIEAARRAGAIAERQGDPARAARLFRTLLDRDPTDEDAARATMRCLAATGDSVGVRRIFKALTEALVHELDDPRAQPSSETRAVFEGLQSSAAL